MANQVERWRTLVFGFYNAPLRFCSKKDRRHVVVQNRLLLSVIPFDGDTGPILFRDDALIGVILGPIHTVADIKGSGLIAGHFAS